MKTWLPATLIVFFGCALPALPFAFVGNVGEKLSEWSPFLLIAKLLGVAAIMESTSMELAHVFGFANQFVGLLYIPCILAGALERKIETRNPNFLLGSMFVGAFTVLSTAWAHPLIILSGYTLALPFLMVFFSVGIGLACLSHGKFGLTSKPIEGCPPQPAPPAPEK